MNDNSAAIKLGLGTPSFVALVARSRTKRCNIGTGIEFDGEAVRALFPVEDDAIGIGCTPCASW